MSVVRKRYIDMTEGVLWKQLTLFAIPLIMGDLFQQLYNTADSVIVGRYIGKQALAAVSATSHIVNTVIGIFTGLSTGATVSIARFFGAKESENLSKAVHTTFFLTLVLSIVLTLAGVGGTPLMLKILATPADVYPVAKGYLTIYFAGISGLIFYNMLGGILRAVGDSTHPMNALIIAAAVNIVLDLLFIVGFGMGVAGAAIATIAAQYMSALYLLIFLTNTKDAYRLSLKKISYDGKILRDIINIGLPTGIQKSVTSLSNVLVISHINYFGSSAMASWGIYQKVDQIDTRIINSMSVAVTTYTSQNIGAKKEKRINAGLRTAIAVSSVMMIVVAIIGIALRRPIVQLFKGDAEVYQYTSTFMCTLLPMRLLLSISMMYSGLLRGFGDSKLTMFILLGCHVGLRQLYLSIGWQYIQTIPFVVSSYVIPWIVSITIQAVYKHVKYDKIIK